jgi:NAD(P)-dependent dehydrogenase (short-subunit alcohol dehydrogenase family)
MAEDYKPTPLVSDVRQSPPIDLSKPYNAAWLKDKHIIVTGGASGFGAGFVQEWASHGASVVIGDINDTNGAETAARIRQETGNEHVHFVHCDVRDWQSQVTLFKEAIRLSPHGGIDVVVANAGIAGIEPLHHPHDLSVDEPRKPNFKVIDVNLIGVLYTTQLALFWLKRNPGSRACSPDVDPAAETRDRCILLIGSMASLGPIVSQPLYGTAKHGVLGLFRSLRASAFVEGVRCNILCPYFIDTPMLPAAGKVLLAGGGAGKVEDVVDAGTRLVADSSILGRGLWVGPKARVKQSVNGEWVVVDKSDADGEEKAIWEAYADDFVDSEIFTLRVVRVLNGIVRMRGWTGWIQDMVAAVKFWWFRPARPARR